MTPSEEAAVEAACAAVRAHRRREDGYRACAPRSAAEVLSARHDGPLDWASFDGRGYELLREVLRRVSGRTEPEGGSPGEPKDAGIKYEERYEPARRRLARARA